MFYAVLGQPVEKQLGISSDNSDFNLAVLVEAWNYLVDSNSDYPALPHDFSWEQVGKGSTSILREQMN